MYSQLSSIVEGRSYIRNQRTRHAVGTGTPPNIAPGVYFYRELNNSAIQFNVETAEWVRGEPGLVQTRTSALGTKPLPFIFAN
jgi:hypothetical protein